MQHNRDLYYLEQMVYHAEEALEFLVKLITQKNVYLMIVYIKKVFLRA